MSLSIAGIGAVQPVLTPPPTAPYAQNDGAAQSVAATTAGAEAGTAAVVYEPSASDTGEQYTYSNRDSAKATVAPPKPANDAAPAPLAGDAAVVEATGGAALPPPKMPETPHAAEVKQMLTNVWAPVKPVAVDPAAGNAAASASPAPVGQAEVAAQASYNAIADAQIAGASLSDVEKFG